MLIGEINDCGGSGASIQEELEFEDLVDVNVISDEDNKEFQKDRRKVYEFKRINRNNDVDKNELKMKNRLLVMT